MALKCVKVATKPFDDQKPGTSGLRKQTKVYMQEHYAENFIQSILSSVGDRLKGCTLAVGGDGRFYCKEVAEKTIQVCAANKVGLGPTSFPLRFSRNSSMFPEPLS